MELMITVTVDAPTPERAVSIVAAALAGAREVRDWEWHEGTCVNRCPSCDERVEHGFYA